jgi:hypothetical protein
LASDLLERALFTFGRAATTLFSKKLAEGKARLEFSRPENRELWLAGYQYIKSLVMKGTYRTAFEWAKLLLSLDPEGDPYCMRLMIHQLALRANEFDWLLDICDSKNDTEGNSPFVQMRGSDAYRYHIAPSLAFAALQLRDGKRSRELLAKSMQRLPWFFTRLFQDLNLDVPPSIWGITPRTSPEDLYTSLCIKYTKALWDTPEATALLMEIAHTIARVDAPSIPTVKDMTLDVVRFVYLDNTPELMAMVPSSLLHRSNNSDSDPIPPDESVISYDSQRIPLQQRDEFGAGMNDYNDPFAALQRFMPPFPNFPIHRRMGPDLGPDHVLEADEFEETFRDDENYDHDESQEDSGDDIAGSEGGNASSTRGWFNRAWLSAVWPGATRGVAAETDEIEEDVDSDEMPDLV